MDGFARGFILLPWSLSWLRSMVFLSVLWGDWQRRDKWVPLILGLEKYAGFAELVEQKLIAVQKAA